MPSATKDDGQQDQNSGAGEPAAVLSRLTNPDSPPAVVPATSHQEATAPTPATFSYIGDKSTQDRTGEDPHPIVTTTKHFVADPSRYAPASTGGKELDTLSQQPMSDGVWAEASKKSLLERRQSEENLFLRRRYSRRKHEGELKLTNRRHASAGSFLPASVAPASTAKGFFGNFDDSRYWDYAFRLTNKGDMGHHCRECKQPFSELNKAIAVRRGGRIELRYHQSCFSMHPDPRSQPTSSANVGKFVDSLKGTEAPEELYRKMRTRGHW